MPLYGHEMDDEITPLETGLNFAVKMNKEDFIGKQALLEKGEPEIKGRLKSYRKRNNKGTPECNFGR